MISHLIQMMMTIRGMIFKDTMIIQVYRTVSVAS